MPWVTDTHNLSQDPDIDLDDDFNMLPIEKMRFAIRDMDLEIDEKRLDEGKIGMNIWWKVWCLIFFEFLIPNS